MAVSQYDKEHLTSDQQAQIQAVTDAAQAGSMDWATAHSIAEGIRSQAAGGGYSGGQDGSGYNPISSGSGNKADPYAGTDYHADAISAARDYAKQASSGGTGDWGAVLDALAMRDQKIAAIGTDYGRSSNDILQELYDLYYAPYQQQKIELPSYGGSRWDSVLNGAANQLISMNYEDWTQGDQYKALADRYGAQGKMSMQDVLGQISSRTGGLASSYATTAAQEQYNEYMSQLEEVARQMYSGDRADLLENAQLSQSLADRDYNRYLDSLQQYYNERDYQYQVGRDQINDQRYNTEWDYQMGRDEIADSRYDQQYADSTAATNKAEAKDRINAYLAAYGSVADLDPALVETSGYTAAELAALEKYYADQRAQEQAAAAKKNTGSSSGSGNGGGTQKPTLTAAQTLNALESGVVNDTTKAAYEYYYGQAWEGEENSGGGQSEPTFSDYSEAVAYMRQNGVPNGNASGAMTKSEWARRKASYQQYGKGGTEVTSYDSYSDYLTAYVQYCIETYGG